MLVPWLIAPGTTGAFYLFLLCLALFGLLLR